MLMKTNVKFEYIILSVLLLYYVSVPNPHMPSPPDDALQSKEPADTETTLRRSYFTNYSREEVISHYRNEFKNITIFNMNMPVLKLNYPPEEAQTIIRDQTRSTYLEELVHPFRASFFINGFEPKESKDAIFIEGRDWEQKITVRYIPSNPFIRMILMGFSLFLLKTAVVEWKKDLRISSRKGK